MTRSYWRMPGSTGRGHIAVTGTEVTGADRFWVRVERGAPDECWPWTGPTGHMGHGLVSVRIDGVFKLIKAHRFAYLVTHGHWPHPCALHGCDNPPCCNAANPLHVHEGTKGDNAREMHARNRQPVHCGPGEDNAGAKLTWEQVAWLRERYAQGGTTQTALAAQLGVSVSTVSDIVHGHSWRRDGQSS